MSNASPASTDGARLHLQIDRSAADAYLRVFPRSADSMTIRPIIKLPDSRLRLVSAPVSPADRDVQTLLDDMFATMYDAPGIGLAAIQIAEPKRVIVMDVAGSEEPREPRCFLNPEIVWASDETRLYEEGCLSIPEVYAEVERSERVKVRYLDRDGRMQEIEASGLLATCLQHEIDHINGVLFIDHISRLKRERIIKKARKSVRRDDDDSAEL
jgi:peptide deformylase